VTKVFNGAILLVGGLALFILGWYVGSQRVSLPSVGELAGIERKATYDRDEYSLRYPTSWKVVELVTEAVPNSTVPTPTHHVAFNRQVTDEGATINDCTLDVRTYAEAASPQLTEWAKRVLGVVNPAFGAEVTFDKTTVGGREGLQVQGGSDLFVENGGQTFYLTAGTRIAQSRSPEAGDSCQDEVNAMLRSFDLK
jgi:hypothetical protein